MRDDERPWPSIEEHDELARKVKALTDVAVDQEKRIKRLIEALQRAETKNTRITETLRIKHNIVIL